MRINSFERKNTLTGSKMSATTVWPATRKNGPVVPPITQKVVNNAMLGARAEPIAHAMIRVVATRYALRRPIIVPMGSQMRAERAMATKTPALAVLMLLGVVLKSLASSIVAVITEVLQIKVGSDIQHTTKRITHFRQEGSSTTSSSMALNGGSGSKDRAPEIAGP